MVIRDERVNMKTFKSHLEEGRKVTGRDILKAIKKDTGRGTPSVLLLVYHNGREMHVSLDLDQYNDGKRENWQFIGNDEDGNEIEFALNDVSRIE